MNKKITDIVAALCILTAIVTGFLLHSEIHHRHIYHDVTLWTIHEAAGILLALSLIQHCFQHKFWFKNYRKIPANKKRVTTVLACVVVIVIVTGVILMCGSRSEEVSLIHYATGILFTILAIGHVCKRWRIFRKI